MANAQIMEEELQQSVRVSEPEADLDDFTDADAVMGSNNSAFASNNQIDPTLVAEDLEDDEIDEEEELAEDEYGAEDGLQQYDEGNEGSSAESEEQDDVEGDEDDDDEDDDAFEDDAEGEEDEEFVTRERSADRRIPSVEEDHDEDDEDEGVGAVKIKPGETDDEDDSDELASSDSNDSESEGDAAWEEAAENNEEDEDDEDEASETANTNACMFCKQDEDHDPAEEFEAFLTCSGCGENSHQQCARNARVLRREQDSSSWRCPECVGEDGEDVIDDNEDDGSPMHAITDADASPAARRASAPKLARDLLPSQKGAIKPDSHSVFNQLVLDEDPMDGSRVLRKRKTSSAEADENIMSLRKRRKNTAESTDGTNGAEETTTRPGSARPLRLKVPNVPATIHKRTRSSIIIKMKVNSSDLRQILSRKPRGLKKRGRNGGRIGRPPRSDRRRSDAAATSLVPSTPFFSSSYTQPFYSFYDKETDELKGKPYGGILSEAEADTSKTMPTTDDRRRFDEAKQKAEEEWRQRLLAMQAAVEVPTRKSRKASGPASQIECIEFGGWEIDTWYAAPYPEEYSRNRVLYICEFCLKYMNSDYVAWRHKLKCPAKHPPGDEIYRHGSMSVFEVDGRKNPVYCQNLCLLAKLFLGSKTLYYDVEPFLFYVLCEYDDLGYHFVGYFSKEKRASSQNNVSCILTLPIHQRKGYGNLLIDFSYLLTRVEQKTGSPEKPLSDMGLVSYRNYWRLVMCRYLLEHVNENKAEKKGLSINQISEDTGMTPDDVISALEGLRCLVRDPETKTYAFRVDLQYCRDYVAKWESKKYVQLDPNALTWTPYVMGRSNATNFELGPALNAIAPREEDEEHKPPPVVGESLPNGDGHAAEGDPADSKPESNIEGDNSLVLESTEPNEVGHAARDPSAEEREPNGVLANGEVDNIESAAPAELEAAVTEEEKADEWMAQYENIPPTRFEVFPPITGTRRVERVRTIISRPPVVRTPSGAPKARPRRSTGSRRSTLPKPKSSTKRKTGGTGRGPGRWPKGTKKSDYGNADSGPGFPPGWLERRGLLPTAVLGAASRREGMKDLADAKDTVQVSTPSTRETKGQRGAEGFARRSGSSSNSIENSNMGVMVDDADMQGEDA